MGKAHVFYTSCNMIYTSSYNCDSVLGDRLSDHIFEEPN